MAQIVENWSDVEGIVREVVSAPELPGFVEVSLDVGKAADVEGFRNLLADSTGTELSLFIPTALADERGVRAGARLVARARKARPDRAFVDPDYLEVR